MTQNGYRPVTLLLLVTYPIQLFSQYVPSTPCPSVFQYQSDSQQWFGVITAPDPPPYGSAMTLEVKMSINARLPTQYVGKIDLYEHGDAVLQRIRQGQPIYYKVYFPLAYPLPHVVSVKFNNRLLCVGRPIYGTQAVTLNLHHHFRSGDQFGNNNQVDGGVQDLLNQGSPGGQPNNNGGPQIIVIDWDDLQNGKIPTTGQIPVAPAVTTTSVNPIPVKNQFESQLTTTQAFDVYSICGTTSKTVALVSNGKRAPRGDWPWLVALFWRKRTSPGEIRKEFKCGSTLISDKVVLTAAHCVTNAKAVPLRPVELLLKLGAYDIDDETDEAAVTRGVAKISVRDDYFQNDRLVNDLALLELYQAVKFTNFIRPVCMWEGGHDQGEIVGKSGVVVGWGKDEEGTSITTEPRIVSVPIVSTTECRASHPYFFHLTTETTFCAGARNGTGPCTGDSGGGLYVKQGNRWTIRGVVSQALKTDQNACNLNQYVIYTDCAKYTEWINAEV